jgi:hypothetical protein
MNLVEIIRREVERLLPKSLQAKVIAVDEEKATCTVLPLGSDVQLYDIKLNAGVNSSIGITPVPKTGSIVTVTMLNKVAGYVALCSEIEKYILICDQIQINDGSKGGLVNWPELLNQLNTEKSRVSTFFDAFLNAVPIASDGGAAIQTAVKTAMTGKSEADYSGLENTKVKH